MLLSNRRSRDKECYETLFDKVDDQESLSKAEKLLLNLADYVYARTSLKPISKTLFFISRCLCVVKMRGTVSSSEELITAYDSVRLLNGVALSDDFDFASVVYECDGHVTHILKSVVEICRLTSQTDSLGLIFNTLLRGKFEGGEGMGTFLTPEEVVYPMVEMLLKAVEPNLLYDNNDLLFGDICGGTGRFVYAISSRLKEIGWANHRLEKAAQLFDQSAMAVDLAKLNFLFEGLSPDFQRVGDSLTSPSLGKLKSRFSLLATNPPFGSSKYGWHASLRDEFPAMVLSAFGFKKFGDTTDPAILFFFRNLDLLASGGAMAIVLPDGIVQSQAFRHGLDAYESENRVSIQLVAIVSLPSITFSLGGTVAKTSFVIVKKTDEDISLYVAQARHVGFLKRGNKRTDDPNGNDLILIASEFQDFSPVAGRVVSNWREHASLSPQNLLHNADERVSHENVLADLVDVIRVFQDPHPANELAYHISVLDVDETGLIDVVAARLNKPISKGLSCEAGDILLSCMNPKIWRVTVVPFLPVQWSCSPEFIVLRPRDELDSHLIALSLHHKDVILAIQAMAKGTSSSRQRVPKDSILMISVPSIKTDNRIKEYISWKKEFYRLRLREADAYEKLHTGSELFDWDS